MLVGSACETRVDVGVRCDASTPCVTGQACVDGFCGLRCSKDGDCPSTERCDAANQRCVLRDSSAGGGSAGGGAGGSSAGGGTAMATPCSAAMPCAGANQACSNGVCVERCTGPGECPAGHYCTDQLCQPRMVGSCPQTPCVSGQSCVSGLCSTPPPPTMCDPEQAASGMDGCDRNAICFDPAATEEKDPKCYSFPACPENKVCPVGVQGAVCNDGLIPNKNTICLTSQCTSASNCPTDWLCFKFPKTAVLGACSNKGPYAPCATGADCLSGDCNIFITGFPGFCR